MCRMRADRGGEPRLRKFSRARRATTLRCATCQNIAIRRRQSRTFACCRLPANGFAGTALQISETDGASEVYREGNRRYVAIKYSVRGRDLGSTVEEAIRK